MKFDIKRFLRLNFPYFFIFYFADKTVWLFRHCLGDTLFDRFYALISNYGLIFSRPLPSFHIYDLLAGVGTALAVKGILYVRKKNAKKYRQGVEYGSARCGA